METVRVEIEIENHHETKVIEVAGGGLAAVLREVRAVAGLDEAYVFERDMEEQIGVEIEKKKSLSVIAHRCKKVRVKVQYEHLTKEESVAPSATVFRVLQWAVSKKAFDLDDIARAKANLMLPGGSEPLPKDAVIGRFVKHDDCELTLDLTLKDFTNG